jgi:hypothetical protein
VKALTDIEGVDRYLSMSMVELIEELEMWRKRCIELESSGAGKDK